MFPSPYLKQFPSSYLRGLFTFYPSSMLADPHPLSGQALKQDDQQINFWANSTKTGRRWNSFSRWDSNRIRTVAWVTLKISGFPLDLIIEIILEILDLIIEMILEILDLIIEMLLEILAQMLVEITLYKYFPMRNKILSLKLVNVIPPWLTWY